MRQRGTLLWTLGVLMGLTVPVNADDEAPTCGRAVTERVSVATDGTEGDGRSQQPAISADGRFVAFTSRASTLVPDDTNNAHDIFVHDRETGVTERVSVASDGTEGNGTSLGVAISADGRFVAFESASSNLVPDDTNGVDDIFVHDRETEVTERVSVASDGTEGNGHSQTYPAISADGRFVAFASMADNLAPGITNESADVFVHDRETGVTERVSVASDGTEGNGDSLRPTITADGRHVVFNSTASNLVPTDTNGVHDVFVHDRETGVTERVSVSSTGDEAEGTMGPPVGGTVFPEGPSGPCVGAGVSFVQASAPMSSAFTSTAKVGSLMLIAAGSGILRYATWLLRASASFDLMYATASRIASASIAIAMARRTRTSLNGAMSVRIPVWTMTFAGNSTLEVTTYRTQFGVVTQDPYLFARSVRDNIAFGRPGATDEEIRAAARDAHAVPPAARYALTRCPMYSSVRPRFSHIR